MASGQFRVVLTSVTGRNGTDAPELLGNQEAAEIINVDLHRSGWRRRAGGNDTSISGTTFTTADIKSLVTHTPSANLAAAELWAAAGTTLARYAAAAWTVPTITDGLADANNVMGASINGKLYLAFNPAAVDAEGHLRLHVYDPTNVLGAKVRRTGLTKPNPPSGAVDVGPGALVGPRWYRIQTIIKDGSGNILAASELSNAFFFTPSGVNAAITVTRGAATGDEETHWRLFAAATTGPQADIYYQVVADTFSGTLTGTEAISGAPPDFSLATPGTVAETVGKYTNWECVRFLVTDGNRLIGAGNFTPGGASSRVWFSAILGTGIGDLERVPQTTDQNNFIDLDEDDGGGITGLTRPIDGIIYVFKQSRIYKLLPTGDASAPYARGWISSSVGCISQRSVVYAEDEFGRPCVYFWSLIGPYRLGADGLQYCGYDIEDVWDSITPGAAYPDTPLFGVYNQRKQQVAYWLNPSSTTQPVLRFHLRNGRGTDKGIRGGWVKNEGDIQKAYHAVMFNNVAADAIYRPHVGFNSGATATKLVIYETTDTTDDGTAFTASVLSRAIATGDQAFAADIDHGMMKLHLIAAAVSSVTLRVSTIRDFNIDPDRTSDISLAASGTETRISKECEDLTIQDAGFTQIKVADQSVANPWIVDAVVAVFQAQEPR